MKRPRLVLITSICGIALLLAMPGPGQEPDHVTASAAAPDAPASTTDDSAVVERVGNPVMALKKSGDGEADSAGTPAEPELEHPEAEASEPMLAHRERGRAQNEIVSFGKSIHIKSNEVADAVVVIGGSAKIDGKVRDAVVAIGGNVTMSGEAQSVVALLGNITLLPGAKSEESVAVGGNLTVEDNAETGEAVAVGGAVSVASAGVVTGEKVSLGLPGFAAPEWAQAWFNECLLKLRPLAPSVGWVWIVAAVVFLFYLVVTLVFRGAVGACVEETMNRPATTFLVGVLSKALIPLLILILIGTGIGIIVVPFVLVAGMVVAVLGKAALIQAIGAGLGRAVGSATFQKPIVAFVIGAIVLVLLFMIPVVGFIVFALVGVWGLGGGVMAAIHKLRRERPLGAAPANPAGPNWPSVAVTSMTGASASVSAGASPLAPSGLTASGSEASGSVVVPPIMNDGSAQAPPPFTSQPVGRGAPAATAPAQPIAISGPARYAGFWERLGAAFLDIVLVVLAANFARLGAWWHLVALAYFSAMWTWRGTTIGGIVLGLRVARANGEALSFAAAFVRALTAGFSALVLFLGFFWIGWDKDKQGWHDKVAGTIVVKTPKSAPLICL